MKVSEIMSKNPCYIKLDTNLKEAAEQMRSHDIGALPVTDGKKIKGMLTDRDIVMRSIALGKDPLKTLAKDAMTEKIQYIYEDDDISKAADAMSSQQIRRLVVLDRKKNLVGLVSMGDLSVKSGDDHLTANLAKHCSEPISQHAMH
ncbi:MAG: CBS domain-containing protein [Proteobacteria bacterium]|nr:CBS domain-containing protein [Pseudomonadota bacterium]